MTVDITTESRMKFVNVCICRYIIYTLRVHTHTLSSMNLAHWIKVDYIHIYCNHEVSVSVRRVEYQRICLFFLGFFFSRFWLPQDLCNGTRRAEKLYRSPSDRLHLLLKRSGVVVMIFREDRKSWGYTGLWNIQLYTQ